jgi:hypothetical protein
VKEAVDDQFTVHNSISRHCHPARTINKHTQITHSTINLVSSSSESQITTAVLGSPKNNRHRAQQNRGQKARTPQEASCSKGGQYLSRSSLPASKRINVPQGCGLRPRHRWATDDNGISADIEVKPSAEKYVKSSSTPGYDSERMGIELRQRKTCVAIVKGKKARGNDGSFEFEGQGGPACPWGSLVTESPSRLPLFHAHFSAPSLTRIRNLYCIISSTMYISRCSLLLTSTSIHHIIQAVAPRCSPPQQSTSQQDQSPMHKREQQRIVVWHEPLQLPWSKENAGRNTAGESGSELA